MNTEYIKKYKYFTKEGIQEEELFALPRKTTVHFWRGIQDFLYDEGYKFQRQPKTNEGDLPYGTATKEVPDNIKKTFTYFREVMDAYFTYKMMNDDKPSKSKDGKVLNSRPKIIDDCRGKVDDIKNDLETMKQEYEEWSEKINEGATQDKCNDAVDTLDTTISQLEEIESELDSLLGELPQGFGRD